MNLNRIRLGDYIKQVNLKNKNEEYKLESVRGISTQKKFIYTKADMTGVSLKKYKIVTFSDLINLLIILSVCYTLPQ